MHATLILGTLHSLLQSLQTAVEGAVSHATPWLQRLIRCLPLAQAQMIYATQAVDYYITAHLLSPSLSYLNILSRVKMSHPGNISKVSLCVHLCLHPPRHSEIMVWSG